MTTFTTPSPETVGLTCMVSVLLAALVLLILGSIWDYIRRRRARDWDLTSFSGGEMEKGEVGVGGVGGDVEDWEYGRGDAVRESRARMWDLERMRAGPGAGGGAAGDLSRGRQEERGMVGGNDCLGRAVSYTAADVGLQRHGARTRHDQFSTSPATPERISSLPVPRSHQQERQQYLLSTPPPAQSSPPRSRPTASRRPVQKLLPQLPLPTAEQPARTPPHPHPHLRSSSSETNHKPLPLTPWVRSILPSPSPPSTLASLPLAHEPEPELTYSSSPPTSSTLPSSSPPAPRGHIPHMSAALSPGSWGPYSPPALRAQTQPKLQARPRSSKQMPASLDLTSRPDGTGQTRLRDPSDSSPTYYFLPLLSPAYPPPAAGGEGGSGLDSQLRVGEDKWEADVQHDDESPTLPPLPVIDTPTRTTKTKNTRLPPRARSNTATRQQHPNASPTPAPRSHTNTQANNPLPPLPPHLAHPPITPTPSIPQSHDTRTALTTHLAASRKWGRGAGRDDDGGRYNVPRKPLAVRKDTAYLNNLPLDHGVNVMTLKGLEVERQKEKEWMARQVLGDEKVGRDVEMGDEKENRRPSDITEMEMEMSMDGEGGDGEDVTPEGEAGEVEGYVGVHEGASGGGVRYPKVPRECAIVWSRARGATWD